MKFSRVGSRHRVCALPWCPYEPHFDNAVMHSHSVGLLKMSEFQSYNLTGVTLV